MLGRARRFATSTAMVAGLLVTLAPVAEAAPLADLHPTAIKRARVVAGQVAHFDSGVWNSGQVGTGVFNVKWLVDGQEVGAYGSHAGVPAQSSKLNGNSQFSHVFDDPGSLHTVTFIVDADNHVPERFERNNRNSVTFRVN